MHTYATVKVFVSEGLFNFYFVAQLPHELVSTVMAGCCQQGHAGSKTLHQQNPPVLSWRCQLTQGDLYSGHKTVVVLLLFVAQLRCINTVC